MDKYSKHLLKKKLFKISFITNFSLCMIASIFAASFIFKEDTNSLKKKTQSIDYSQAYVCGITDAASSISTSNSSGTQLAQQNHLGLTLEYDSNQPVLNYESYDSTSNDNVPLNYQVTFYDEDGITIIESNIYSYGDPLILPDIPFKEEDITYKYVFSSWGNIQFRVTESINYTASYFKIKK